MVNNCLAYNERETIFYRAGTKMRDLGGSIIRQARRQADMLGIDQETGMLTGEGGSKKEEVSDDRLMREIDEFLNDESARESLDDEEHLKRLLDVQDKAGLIHHPSAKKRRQQAIKVELQKLRRKVSIEKSGEKVGKKDRLGGDGEPSEKVEEEEEEEAVHVKKKGGRSKEEEKKDKKAARPKEDGGGKKKSVPKEEKEAEVKKKAGRPPKSKKPEDNKRKREASDEDSEQKEDTKKKLRKGDSDSDEKTKKRIEKSPEKTGVNRRNAVLFTRKKEAAKTEEKPSLKPDEASKARDEAKKTDEFEFHEPDSPKATPVLKKRGRKPRRSEDRGERGEFPSCVKASLQDV